MSVKLNGVVVGNDCYPNNERMYDSISSNIESNSGIAELSVHYLSSVDFENMMILGGYINELKVAKRVLNLWYVPYLRMDRQVGVKDPMIWGIINILKTVFGWWDIKILDPHINITERIGAEVIPVEPFIRYVMENESIEMICYPDIGARMRYDMIGGVPVAHAKKERDIDTGKIKAIQLEKGIDCLGRNVLIIDDICSYGGTSNAVAQQLKELGANKVIAWYSHTELSIYKGTLLKDGHIDKVYTSNSIMEFGPRITFLTLRNGVVECIKNTPS